MRVLVTGATGFVGGAVLDRLLAGAVRQCRGAIRHSGSHLHPAVEPVLVGELTQDTDWTHAVRGMDAIVHTAARVHVMHDIAPDPLTEFRRINVAGTLRLARQAVEAGVRRFVFISSVKVNGEGTSLARPYTADDAPAPVDPYGISKHEAEQGLRQLARETGLEVVVIRPVLVYGPGVKGNFLSMMRWVDRGIPLPLGAIDNKRSLVARGNLVDLIMTCLRHPAAANQTFLVSDGEDLSTTALLRRLGTVLDKPARLVPIPARVIQATARMLGQGEIAQRLCGSLQVDIRKTRALLGWTPIVSVGDALQQTAAHYFLQSRN